MNTVTRSAFPLFFFSRAEKKAITDAITEAEKKTSAEIRVHVEGRAQGELMDDARQTFLKLGMNQAKESNAVLVFFETSGRRFAVIGGQAIHDRTQEGFWQEQVDRMERSFRRDRFAEGLTAFVHEVGDLLARHFPRQPEDTNEFPDKISFRL